ncbi:MAG: universal stress protein, partial [Desulfobacter sp.]
MSDEKRILVTLDGSKRSKRTIDYLCSFTPFKTRQVTLFNITTPVPEAYYDLNQNSFGKIAVS